MQYLFAPAEMILPQHSRKEPLSLYLQKEGHKVAHLRICILAVNNENPRMHVKANYMHARHNPSKPKYMYVHSLRTMPHKHKYSLLRESCMFPFWASATSKWQNESCFMAPNRCLSSTDDSLMVLITTYHAYMSRGCINKF